MPRGNPLSVLNPTTPSMFRGLDVYMIKELSMAASFLSGASSQLLGKEILSRKQGPFLFFLAVQLQFIVIISYLQATHLTVRVAHPLASVLWNMQHFGRLDLNT